MDQGVLISSEESDAPPVPDIGTDVTIDAEFDGQIIPNEEGRSRRIDRLGQCVCKVLLRCDAHAD